jgi:hypothetical protein
MQPSDLVILRGNKLHKLRSHLNRADNDWFLILGLCKVTVPVDEMKINTGPEGNGFIMTIVRY